MSIEALVTELPVEIASIRSAKQALRYGVPAAEILYCLTVSMWADPCVYWKIVNTGFPRRVAARVAAQLTFSKFQDTQEAGVTAEEFDTVLETQGAYFRGYASARIGGANHEEAMELACRKEGWHYRTYKQLRVGGTPHSEALTAAAVAQVYLDARATKSPADALQATQDFLL